VTYIHPPLRNHHRQISQAGRHRKTTTIRILLDLMRPKSEFTLLANLSSKVIDQARRGELQFHHSSCEKIINNIKSNSCQNSRSVHAFFRASDPQSERCENALYPTVHRAPREVTEDSELLLVAPVPQRERDGVVEAA